MIHFDFAASNLQVKSSAERGAAHTVPRAIPLAIYWIILMKRLHVLGGPGSGKTALAKIICELSGLPHIELDHMAYADSDFFRPRCREDRLAAVKTYSSKEAWVAEGVYFSWIGRSLKYADRIYHLTIDQVERQRNIDAKLSLRFPERDERHARHLAMLSLSNSEYDALYKNRIEGFLKPVRDKLIIVHSMEDALKEFGTLRAN
ncbi:hypothetical protein [Janthinobacterium sp. RA13]|uniref:hypothetical protein n=1 Tax=Janthinobacterium sp. RA13 TaxID=1502762 RepID=UPI0006913354|nr:hypothetical protein [Janthinobacterium sp. RA13]